MDFETYNAMGYSPIYHDLIDTTRTTPHNIVTFLPMKKPRVLLLHYLLNNHMGSIGVTSGETEKYQNSY